VTAPTPHPPPTPERFVNAMNAYQQTEGIKAAIELEIFTAIAEGNSTAATIAKRCKGVERGVRILCDFLTIHGFLTKQGAAYSLPEDSALFLDRHSPAYVGSAIEFLLTPRLLECHAHLTEAVRRGGTALGEGMLDPEALNFSRGELSPQVEKAAFVLKEGEWSEVEDTPSRLLFIELVKRDRQQLGRRLADLPDAVEVGREALGPCRCVHEQRRRTQNRGAEA